MDKPTGFDRATGSLEGRRQCEDCNRLYPVTDHESGNACPFCKNERTSAVAVGTKQPAIEREE